ncbi:minor capsid protein [Enterococcus faecalis]|nr:minor capsid protein [Enterococcus faecalis]
MSNYWAKREAKHIDEVLKRHSNYEKEIHSRFQALYEIINFEIQQFYSIYSGKEKISISEAKRRVNKHDVEKFAEQAKRYVQSRDFSKEANDQLRLYNLTMKVNRLELLKSKIGLYLTDNTDQLQRFFNNNLKEEAVQELKRQAGILGETIREVDYYQTLAKSIVTGSFKNATFSQRLWMNQDILKANIDRLLSTGLTSGKHPDVMARKLRQLVAIDSLRGKETADYVARRLMISESSRIQSEVQKKSYEKHGYNEFNLIAEPTACSICKGIASDGPYKVENMSPGENASPIHNWCRCSTVPSYRE